MLGAPHPDALLEALTWEQWHGWERFYAHDPWGEWRADLRAAVNTMEAKGSDAAFQLQWPYIESTEDIEQRADDLKQRSQEVTAGDLKERLKKAREQHLKTYGNQHQQTGNHADGGHVGAE